MCRYQLTVLMPLLNVQPKTVMHLVLLLNIRNLFLYSFQLDIFIVALSYTHIFVFLSDSGILIRTDLVFPCCMSNKSSDSASKHYDCAMYYFYKICLVNCICLDKHKKASLKYFFMFVCRCRLLSEMRNSASIYFPLLL